MHPVGFGSEYFVSAMAQWHMGDKNAAIKFYGKGAQWMKEHQQQLATMQSRWLDRRRFQMEAAALLGLPIPNDVPPLKN
jgi:hypothetical protein